ncbi:activating signal cointegrator 1 complex subunit 2-like [Tropilaelaps mercedesae]|uniref:Activating signal cointegrator 1 complex subunit 2-like n=1 Tax=Tropilaelaps mercedesae TaxID=418985 RepID=A0A1V9XL52_9ACAR|nr:activating signal cointegrator 1 complex subunit 2-like [Tropilaelaps mercedesae]
MSAGGNRKQEVQGAPADTVFKDLEINGTLSRVPLLNRGNLKAEHPYYWLYSSPASIFPAHDRLRIVGGDFSCAKNYEAEIDEWCTCAQYLVNDLQSILRMKYYKFWSSVLFDEDLHLALESYLRLAPRWFDISFLVTPLMQAIQDKLHDLVIKIFMRMSTWRESKTDHLTPSKFAEYLWHDIYDIARISDICVLYGYTEEAPVNSLIKKMIMNVLNRQPELTSEFQLFAHATLESIASLKDSCTNKDPIANSGNPSLLAAASLLDSASLKSMDENEIFHLCQGAAEVPVSVLHLMRHIPNNMLNSLENVVNAIPQFFHLVYPTLDEELERRQGTLLAAISDQIREMLCKGQFCALELFRYFIQVMCIDPLLSNTLNENDSLKLVEKYYSMAIHAVEETSFIVAYNSVYALGEDLNVFRRNPLTKDLVDESQFQYLLTTLQMATTEVGLEHNVLGEPETRGGAVGGSTPEVETILAIIPDLRPEFVEKCLEFYHRNVDEVVSALLDSNIHPELEKYRAEPEPVCNVKQITEGEDAHIGKKNQFAQNFLDDHKAKDGVRKIVLQYSETYNDVEVKANNKMYDDEYDDTYDSVYRGLPEKDSEEADRVFEVPRVLQKSVTRKKAVWELAQEQEIEEDTDTARQRQKAFCEDPEVIRARRERRYQANQVRKGRLSPQERDVVGVTRGQGQSEEVLRNRQLKERHKGKNRRAQADWKRREF